MPVDQVGGDLEHDREAKDDEGRAPGGHRDALHGVGKHPANTAGHLKNPEFAFLQPVACERNDPRPEVVLCFRDELLDPVLHPLEGRLVPTQYPKSPLDFAGGCHVRLRLFRLDFRLGWRRRGFREVVVQLTVQKHKNESLASRLAKPPPKPGPEHLIRLVAENGTLQHGLQAHELRPHEADERQDFDGGANDQGDDPALYPRGQVGIQAEEFYPRRREFKRANERGRIERDCTR
mmetsp:Transcript_22224/g.54762  ORF Transcript_22224/g.54762 Transcript_22224/m.54762 type:complete len:235 (-) Transcript_22224:1028-1732(-)